MKKEKLNSFAIVTGVITFVLVVSYFISLTFNSFALTNLGFLLLKVGGFFALLTIGLVFLSKK
jgi:hypothetical protein